MGRDAAPYSGAQRGLNIDAVAITAQRFGIVGTATPLPGYSDENFRIETETGEVFVLKVTSRDREHVRLQAAVFDAIRSKTPYETPKTVAAGSNTAVTLLDGRTARLLTWVEGTSFSDSKRPPDNALAIGVAVGRIVDALEPVAAASTDRPDWAPATADHTIRERAAAVNDERRRTLVLEIAGVVAELDLTSLPRQIIHGDLNDDNVLLADGRVSGVIDAGDAMHTIRIAEPAIAAAYAILDQNDPPSVAHDLIAGFASIVAIAPEEAEVIWPLIKGRLATSVVMAASGPRDNPHRVKSENQVWDILERFPAGNSDLMAEQVLSAARHASARVRDQPPDAPPAR